jgi:hypothetical protein
VTTKVYVGRDSDGRPWPPDYNHEALATIDVIKRLWSAFDSHEGLYAAVANLHRPSADLVVISERGLGIMELKHYYGSIIQQTDGTWYAGPQRIEAGAENQGYRNPREQVQAYAQEIRSELVNPTQSTPWLPGVTTDWNRFKFQTSVCFTHPDASIGSLRRAFRRQSGSERKDWEEFTVLKPDEVPAWTAALRFEAAMGQRYGFEPHCLTPKQITRIALRLFDATEWTEIIKLMPTGAPYAYLTLIEQGQRTQVFGLDRDQVLIGRDADNCAVPIPQVYAYAGRIHSRIKRSAQGIFIKDQDSKNGTYVDGHRLEKGKSKLLELDHRITLGGAVPGPKVCLFKFSLARPKPGTTETHTALNRP